MHADIALIVLGLTIAVLVARAAFYDTLDRMRRYNPVYDKR